LCALSYVIQVEQVDAQANAQLIASAVARALGHEVEIVDPGQVRRDFDTALRADPEAEDDAALLLEGLGLRRWRGGDVDR
jgi:hypothetical protein